MLCSFTRPENARNRQFFSLIMHSCFSECCRGDAKQLFEPGGKLRLGIVPAALCNVPDRLHGRLHQMKPTAQFDAVPDGLNTGSFRL